MHFSLNQCRSKEFHNQTFTEHEECKVDNKVDVCIHSVDLTKF